MFSSLFLHKLSRDVSWRKIYERLWHPATERLHVLFVSVTPRSELWKPAYRFPSRVWSENKLVTGGSQHRLGGFRLALLANLFLPYTPQGPSMFADYDQMIQQLTVICDTLLGLTHHANSCFWMTHSCGIYLIFLVPGWWLSLPHSFLHHHVIDAEVLCYWLICHKRLQWIQSYISLNMNSSTL